MGEGGGVTAEGVRGGGWWIAPPYNGRMEIRFSPEVESKLNQAAAAAGNGVEEYVRDLVERHLDEDARFREAVRKGFASIDEGHFLEEEEMDAIVDRMLRAGS